MNDSEREQQASAGDDIPFESLQVESGVRSRHGTFHSPTRFDPKEIAKFDSLSWIFRKDRLDRKPQRKHITGIAFSGTVGIGLFVTSGQFIGISGSPGSTIAFLCAGFIVVGVMRSLAELVSVRPVSGALIDYPHTFVDEALGFAVAVTYWLAQCVSNATLTAAAARAADDFGNGILEKKNRAGIITGLYWITLFSNLCGVKAYGVIERCVKWFKLLLIIGLCILMILVRAGVRQSGEKLPQDQRSFTFAPDLNFIGQNATESASDASQATIITGEWGQFLGLWICVIYAMFACVGGDLVIVSAGEAESPRIDLPPTARFMYMAPIGSYIIASVLVGLNVNFNEPGLYHPFANVNLDGYHSPFILALKYTSIETLPAVLNACFLIAAYTAANTALFASSRTLFSLARLYGGDFMKNTIGRTNNGHTPILAILICSVFGLLAFLGLEDTEGYTFNQPVLTLSAFFTGSIACVYGCECIAFLRFKHGLTIHKRNSTFSRDSVEYTNRGHYRAHWQPFCAWTGLIGCILIVIFSGWPAIYLLCARQNMGEAGDALKPSSLLVADVVGAYSGPVLFAALYIGYKLRYRTSFRQFREFERAYFLPEFDIPDLGGAYAARANNSGWGNILDETWSLVW